MLRKSIPLILLVASLSISAQVADPWITYPTANVNAYGVYHFRRTFELDLVPSKLGIQVSADNRYQLFINGKRVSYGPAKGDLQTYKYDELDISKYLRKGQNVIAALVFNMGKDRPMALITAQTAFLLRAVDDQFLFLNTDENWKTFKNPAYDPIWYEELNLREWLRGYYAVGPGDEVFADRYPWGWEQVEFDDSAWLIPEILDFNGSPPWRLVPRDIAFMDNYEEAPGRVRKVTGITIPSEFRVNDQPVVVPANTQAKILYDYGYFTMGYPELVMEGGTAGKVKITYNETLYEEPFIKAHRDSVDGKIMYGPFDIFHPDGGQQTFRPIWKRAFRYVELEINTSDEPLTIYSLKNEYSGYPYKEVATFRSDDPKLDRMFEMSLRTLRMCSGETYYDTPFFEQMSYGGDNRPIAAISGYNTTDDRLFREMMRIYPQSFNQETGLFKAAYPSRFDFDKGSWSQAWIQTLWDYFQLRGDTTFSRQFVNDIEGVLNFYLRHLDEALGVLGPFEGHHYLDWSKHSGKVPSGLPRWYFEHSAGQTLFYAHTLDCAVNLYRAIGEIEKALKWQEVSEMIRKSAYVQFWDTERKLFREYPDRDLFIQHTNILAILCDAIPEEDQSALMERIVNEKFDEEVSSFFAFFLFKAMEKAGREDLYFSNLDHWYHFMDMGLTTCGETGFASHDRSDCHAWSGSPGYYHLRFIAGIKPADIGFEHIMITPHPGDLKKIVATMPHSKGRISAAYQVEGNKLTGKITLPAGMKGEFLFGATRISLKPGSNLVEAPL